jgi:hypothetical protein
LLRVYCGRHRRPPAPMIANRLLRLHVGPSGLASCLSQDQPPDARKTPCGPAARASCGGASSVDLSSASKAALNSVSAISFQFAASPSSRSNSLIANLRTSTAPASASAGFFGVLAAGERAFLIVQLYHIFRVRRGAPCPPCRRIAKKDCDVPDLEADGPLQGRDSEVVDRQRCACELGCLPVAGHRGVLASQCLPNPRPSRCCRRPYTMFPILHYTSLSIIVQFLSAIHLSESC